MTAVRVYYGDTATSVPTVIVSIFTARYSLAVESAPKLTLLSRTTRARGSRYKVDRVKAKRVY